MSMTPRPNIEHNLMVQEPFPPSDLPTEDVLGLTCMLIVRFTELEEIINRSLGRDTAKFGNLSFAFTLSQLAPEEHLFVSIVHLIDIRTGSVSEALKPFIEDYDFYLEPIRLRLEDISILSEDNYVPATVDPWSWRMRRAAYYYCYGDHESKGRYLDWLEKQVDTALQDQGHALEAPPFVSSDIKAFQQSGIRRMLEETRRLIVALR